MESFLVENLMTNELVMNIQKEMKKKEGERKPKQEEEWLKNQTTVQLYTSKERELRVP